MAERTDTVRKMVPMQTRLPTQVLRAVLGALCWCALPAHSDPLRNDYPTTARVEFVQDCMGRHGGKLEDLYKCSCAIDDIAAKVDYVTWVDLSTVANATTIAGERGGVMRDMKDGRKIIVSFRELQAGAKKHCFLDE